MEDNSIILNMLINILRRCKYYIDNSISGRLYKNCIAVLMEIWQGSTIRKILYCDAGYDEKIKKSVFYRILIKITELITAFLCRLNGLIEKSTILSTIDMLYDSLLYVSSDAYGQVLIPFGFAAGAIALWQGYSVIVPSAVLAAGILLIIVNRPFKLLYEGSILAKAAGDFFCFSFQKESKTVYYSKMMCRITGIVMGLCFNLLGIQNFILILGGIFAFGLIIKKTEAGIYLNALCIPLFPTKFILGITALSALSFFIKVFITKKIKIRFQLIDLAVILFALLIVYSTVISFEIRSSAVVAAVYLLYIIFYFVVKNTILKKEQIRITASFFIISGFLTAALGVFQKVTGTYVFTESWVDTEMFEGATVRIYSTFENPNVLGMFLIFAVLITFSVLYYEKNYFYKLIITVFLGITALCMIYTQSRGAWLGVIFAFGLFALIKDRRLLWLGIAGIMTAPLFMPASVLSRFMSIGNVSDSSTAYRVSIWKGSLEMIKDYWPIGIGPGNDVFIFIYQKYALSASYALHAHNLYLQIIIELGVAGIFLFGIIIFLFYKNVLTVSECKNEFLTAFSAAMGAAAGGFLLQGMTDNVWYNYRIVLFFWFIIALSGCCSSAVKGINND